MIVFTRKLIKLIRQIFGHNNANFDKEIKQVKIALFVFAFAYSLRVIRNTLVTIYWAPCFAVHRQLTTNLVNMIFYILCEWIAIFFMMQVHNKNYSAKIEHFGSQSDIPETEKIAPTPTASKMSDKTSEYSVNSEADFDSHEPTSKLGETAPRRKILSLQSKFEKEKTEQALNELTNDEFVIKKKEDYLLTYEDTGVEDKQVRRSSINIG